MPAPYRYAPAVAEALAEGRPVVALESTIISHGLPYPDNLALAREVESIVRLAGAEPATIAVLDGEVRVGCTDEDLERLATDPGIIKASLRDLPVLLARRGSGATTVAATATIAAAAGVRVFVTGGIGGVHRAAAGPGSNWEQNWDVSADLTVLGREPLIVVSAGAKSILDIGATLEVLETLGVTVLGYRTDRFPGFFVRETPHGVDARVEGPQEVAAAWLARRSLSLPGALLLVNPCPEDAALPAAEVEALVEAALAEAADRGVRGKALTPFLLERLRQATAGRALAANLALVRSNAALGAQVAVALAQVQAG